MIAFAVLHLCILVTVGSDYVLVDHVPPSYVECRSGSSRPTPFFSKTRQNTSRHSHLHNFDTRCFSVFQWPEYHSLVEVFVIQWPTNLEELEDRAEILQDYQTHNLAVSSTQTYRRRVDLWRC